MNIEEMTKWVFTQMIEGMLDGKPLRTISGEIAVGISNATAQNIKEYTARNQKPQASLQEHDAEPAKYNPADFSVSVVVRGMNSFAPISTAGVTVTHIPSGLSVTEENARSQHANRMVAFEKLMALLAAQQIEVAEHRESTPQVPSWEHAGYFYNETMHALMDVGAPHGGCKFRLNIMAEELRKLMQHKDN